MSYEYDDGAIEREIKYFNLPLELMVNPVTAQEYLSRRFDSSYGEPNEILRQMYDDGEWGSHIDRAVLSIAVESDTEKEYDLAKRIMAEMTARPQALIGVVMQTPIQEAAFSRIRSALFDARCYADSENPSLEQFIYCWK